MNNGDTLSAKLVESDSQSECWRASRGTLRLSWTESGCMLVVLGVHGDRALAPLMTRRADAIIAQTKLTLFFDFWEMPTYDSEMRMLWTQWLLSHRSHLNGLHVLARSKLVSMGVSVANLALGGIIQSYPTPSGPFEQALVAVGLKLPER
jgi:hypothetical protein